MPGSIWKGSISFGLINIPVSLQKAQEGSDLSFTMLDEKDLSPLKYKKVNSKDGREVPWQRVVKGYQYEKGQYVVLTKEDLKAANPKATQTIDIEDFVEMSDIDLMYLEKPYYLVPQKTGMKGYFLLMEALKKTKKVAIAKFIFRTKMHLVMIMVKDNILILELLRFEHEVLGVDEMEFSSDLTPPKFSAKEIKMAQELVEGMTAEWKPEQYKDTYNDDVLKIIKMKIKAGEGHNIEWALPKSDKLKSSNVVDLMPLLKQSLEQKKKERVHKKPRTRKKAG